MCKNIYVCFNIIIHIYIYMYILPSGAWKGSKHGAQVSLMFWIDTLVKLVLESKGYQ